MTQSPPPKRTQVHAALQRLLSLMNSKPRSYLSQTTRYLDRKFTYLNIWLYAWRALWRVRADDPYARIHEVDNPEP